MSSGDREIVKVHVRFGYNGNLQLTSREDTVVHVTCERTLSKSNSPVDSRTE